MKDFDLTYKGMKKGPLEVVMTGSNGRSLVAEAEVKSMQDMTEEEAKKLIQSLQGDILDRLIGLSDANYALGFYTEVIIIEDAITEIKNLRRMVGTE